MILAYMMPKVAATAGKYSIGTLRGALTTENAYGGDFGRCEQLTGILLSSFNGFHHRSACILRKTAANMTLAAAE
jgi:hypothetical protein